MWSHRAASLVICWVNNFQAGSSPPTHKPLLHTYILYIIYIIFFNVILCTLKTTFSVALLLTNPSYIRKYVHTYIPIYYIQFFSLTLFLKFILCTYIEDKILCCPPYIDNSFSSSRFFTFYVILLKKSFFAQIFLGCFKTLCSQSPHTP